MVRNKPTERNQMFTFHIESYITERIGFHSHFKNPKHKCQWKAQSSLRFESHQRYRKKIQQLDLQNCPNWHQQEVSVSVLFQFLILSVELESWHLLKLKKSMILLPSQPVCSSANEFRLQCSQVVLEQIERCKRRKLYPIDLQCPRYQVERRFRKIEKDQSTQRSQTLLGSQGQRSKN